MNVFYLPFHGAVDTFLHGDPKSIMLLNGIMAIGWGLFSLYQNIFLDIVRTSNLAIDLLTSPVYAVLLIIVGLLKLVSISSDVDWFIVTAALSMFCTWGFLFLVILYVIGFNSLLLPTFGLLTVSTAWSYVRMTQIKE